MEFAIRPFLKIQKDEFDYCTLYTKIIARCIIDLNMKGDTIKCMKENIKMTLLWSRQSFLKLDTKITSYKRKLINWTLSKFRTFVY